jgi:hypothetical protein
MRKQIFIISFLVLSLFGSVRFTQADISYQAAVEGNHRSIAAIVEALGQIRVDASDPRVPPAARPLLTDLKHRLRDLIQKALDANDTQIKNLAKINEYLRAELDKQNIHGEKAGSALADDVAAKSYIYGDIQQISIHAINGYPNLIGATTTIGVSCGTDSSFYLFRKSGQRWVLILAQEANDYEDVSGAQGGFGYQVSPPSDKQQLFVVTKNVNPWCTSNWQAIRYKVLRPSQTAYQPRVLMEKSETIFLGRENDGLITTTPDSFTIAFDAGQRLDVGVLVRRHMVSYKVDNDKVSRISPLAMEPEGFLDEWFGLPWTEASKWIAGQAFTGLYEWHERMNKGYSEQGTDFFSEFIYQPAACRINERQWLIGLEFSANRDKILLKGVPKRAYFTVTANQKGEYFIKGISLNGVQKCEY